MTIQDDERERYQRELFGLNSLPDESRGGIDAVLQLDSVTQIPFELKTTSTGSVTTVRDFGFDHVKKWRPKHWLISRYSKDGSELQYSIYGSPAMMAPWIEEKAEYIRVDYELGELAPRQLSLKDMFALIGEKDAYTLKDAQRLQKRQLLASDYHNLMDLPAAYSKYRMLELLQDRCRYLIRRGSTLNNPHIPLKYFDGWERITSNHKSRLRELVHAALRD